MDAQRELVINPDERAIEACLLNQAGAAVHSQANAAYYEPQTIADVARQGRLVVLAEGIGGTFSGHVASQYATQKVIHSFYTGKTPDLKTRLLGSIQQANADILERNSQHPDRRPLAATLVAALLHNSKLIVASVGDNRVYVVWDQDIERLAPGYNAENPATETNQDSPKTEATAEPDTAGTPDPARIPMPAGLGLTLDIQIDTYARRLFPGDVVILCSGGLTGYLQEKEIARAVNRHDGNEAIQRMFALTAERGYGDSGAIGVARILSEPIGARPPASMPLPAAPDWSQWEKAATAAQPAKKSAAGTQPMAQPVKRPQFKRPPGFMPDQKQRLNPKLFVGLAAVALLVVCAVLFVFARYWVPPKVLAAVPFANSLGLVDSAAGEQSQVVRRPSSTPTAGSPTATPTPTAAVTLVAKSNSRPATPSPITTAASKADIVSPVVTPTPSPTPLPLPTIVLPKGCESKGRFVRDATIPDGTQVAPGEKFEKVWIVQNAGDCPWGPGFTVQHKDGEPMGAANVIPLREQSQPDEQFEVRVAMVAPAKPGQYRAVWQLHDLNDAPFGPELYLDIEVAPVNPLSAGADQANVLYDFVANAARGDWSSGDVTYAVQSTAISETLPLPLEGIVAVGPAQLRGNKTSQNDALLTYPHQENGFIEGKFRVDTALQPTDTFAAELGFTKLSILSDDGVKFEVTFTPDGGQEQAIFSTLVDYRDSPVTEVQPLTGIPSGSTGTFTLRVLGGESLSQDWALWISARLVRPQ